MKRAAVVALAALGAVVIPGGFILVVLYWAKRRFMP